MRSRSKRLFTVITAVVGITAVAAAFVSTAGGKTEARKGQERYTIYLSNNFVGNDYRQQMLRSARVVTRKGPLAGRIDLRIENVETTATAQINSLNNMIRARPDAIIIDAGSGTALNPTIRRACARDILVISFDQVVTEPCAYKIQSDFSEIPRVLAAWMARILKGRGDVFIDRGLAGAPISAQITNGYLSVLRRFPNINIVGRFNGNYALGPEQSGVASLLAANPDVDGILTQGYGVGALRALRQAGRPPVPVTAFAYNTSAVSCAQTRGARCILGSNAPYLSADALRLAVQVLDGDQPNRPRTIISRTPYFTTNVVSLPGFRNATLERIRIGRNAFPNLAPGLSLPISPNWVRITPQEAAG